MSQDDPATIFRRGMEAYSRGDYEAAIVAFDPAIEWGQDPTLPYAAALLDLQRHTADRLRHVSQNRLAITRAHGTGAGSC